MRLRALLISSSFTFVAAGLAAACTDSAADKGAEDGALTTGDGDGKADSLKTPTDLGTLASGATAAATLASTSRYLAWELDTYGDADLSLDTSRAPHAASVDTVLYLYKQGASGWGSYIARNDDAGASMFSTIEQHVGAGHYRVIVKGYKSTTYGKLQLSYACGGAGCAPSCAFGDTFAGIDPSRFAINGPTTLTAASSLTALEQAQIVRAMHASTHTDVTTAAQAFAAADGHVIDEYQLRDWAGVRTFTAFQYGAGDNPYGAIFAHGAVDVATEIHDGDLTGCTVQPAVCVFGQHGEDYATSAAMTIGTKATYAHASSVPVAVQAEIVAAVRLQHPEVGAIEEVWPLVTDGKVARVDVTHAPSGRAFTVITFVLGDHEFGAAYAKGTTDRAVTILDDVNEDCRAF